MVFNKVPLYKISAKSVNTCRRNAVLKLRCNVSYAPPTSRAFGVGRLLFMARNLGHGKLPKKNNMTCFFEIKIKVHKTAENGKKVILQN